MDGSPDEPWVPPRLRTPPPMDHAPGWKESAYTPQMGELILARIAAGETVRQITADAAMPSYPTVFRWVQVHEDFGAAYRALRARLGAEAIAREAGRREARAWRRAHEEKQGWRPRRGRGRRSTYTMEAAEAVCARIAAGRTLTQVVAEPGQPSFRAIYRWLKNEPEFRQMYVDACQIREMALEAEVDDAALTATPANLRAAKARVAWLQGRIGRLTPKTYRALP